MENIKQVEIKTLVNKPNPKCYGCLFLSDKIEMLTCYAVFCNTLYNCKENNHYKPISVKKKAVKKEKIYEFSILL